MRGEHCSVLQFKILITGMGCLRAINGFQNNTLTDIALGSPAELDRKTLLIKTIHILDTGHVETKQRQGNNCLSCQLAFTVPA